MSNREYRLSKAIDLHQTYSMLLFLMEQKNLQQSHLVDIFGSNNIILEVVNGQREISRSQAQALSDIFHVDPGVFI